MHAIHVWYVFKLTCIYRQYSLFYRFVMVMVFRNLLQNEVRIALRHLKLIIPELKDALFLCFMHYSFMIIGITSAKLNQ